MSSFTLALLLLSYSVHSCSIPDIADGTQIITKVQLLSNNPDSALLTFEQKMYTETSHCKVLNTIDLTIGSAVDCNDQQTRDWSVPTADSTKTVVSEFKSNGDNSTGTMTITRNNVPITVNISIEHDAKSMIYSKKFTLPSLNTTYIILSKEMYGEMQMYAVKFDDDVSYSMFEVNMNGDWRDLDMTSSQNIDIYESVEVMELPLVCCLCYSTFLVSYEIAVDEGSNEYNFTISHIVSGATVDVEGERAYQLSLVGDSVSIYDLSENAGKKEAMVYDIGGNTETTRTSTTMDPQSKAFARSITWILFFVLSTFLA